MVTKYEEKTMMLNYRIQMTFLGISLCINIRHHLYYKYYITQTFIAYLQNKFFEIGVGRS